MTQLRLDVSDVSDVVQAWNLDVVVFLFNQFLLFELLAVMPLTKCRLSSWELLFLVRLCLKGDDFYYFFVCKGLFD